MASFSRSKFLIFGVLFIFALVPVVSPTSFVSVAYADEGEGDAEGTGGTGTGSGGVSDVNDGTPNDSGSSNNFLTVTTSCNANGTADASISFFFGLYPPYHVLSMQILKDGAVVQTLGSYGATNPEGITSLGVYQEGISFTNFAAGSTYEVRVGDLAANLINTDTGQEIDGWNFSQVASRTFGPLTCPAPDLVGYQTAIYGYSVNDSRKVTPGALQFNSGVGNQGNAWSGPFNVQVEVKTLQVLQATQSGRASFALVVLAHTLIIGLHPLPLMARRWCRAGVTWLVYVLMLMGRCQRVTVTTTVVSGIRFT